MRVVKWLMPISSSEDLRLPVDWPIFGSPWRNELDRRRRMSLSIYCDKKGTVGTRLNNELAKLDEELPIERSRNKDFKETNP